MRVLGNGERAMTSIEIFGWLATLGFFVSYFPQLLRTWKSKSVDDISVGMWYVLLASYTNLFIYGALLGRNAIIMNALLGGACTVVMVVMHYLYRDLNKRKARAMVKWFIAHSQKELKERDNETED